MPSYTRFAAAERPWADVLTSADAVPLTFDVISIGANGGRIYVRNTDGTTTTLIGSGLAATVDSGEGARAPSRLVAGTVTLMRRMAPDGTPLETVSGLSLPATGPASLSSPADGRAGLAALLSADREPETPQRGLAMVAGAGTARDGESGAGDMRGAHILPTAGTSGRRPVFRGRPLALLAFLGGLAAGVTTLAWFATAGRDGDLARLKQRYVRPASIPYPPDNVPTRTKVELGRRLFTETRLSADGTVACATCHDPERAFTDGRRTSLGIAREPLRLHTPTLWNVAWGNAFFWDGRAPTLEVQARGPLEDPKEMGQKIETSARILAEDLAYVQAFAAAFPEAPGITPESIVKALATYERTLVSPVTRFDRWIGGDDAALNASEVAGFKLFNGRAGCARCHQGWALTDHAFHDIGLPARQVGRGRIIGVPALDHAFKTPPLRELAWTAPYMHDGSLATLEEVLRHYETGGADRPTRSPDLPRGLDLTEGERRDLLAFLRTLSGDRPSQPLPNMELASRRLDAQPSALSMTLIGQKEKRFSPERVRIDAGQTITVTNNDDQPHNVRIDHPRLTFHSGLQDPGEDVSLAFAEPGSYQVYCGIHPNMRLHIDVTPKRTK